MVPYLNVLGPWMLNRILNNVNCTVVTKKTLKDKQPYTFTCGFEFKLSKAQKDISHKEVHTHGQMGRQSDSKGLLQRAPKGAYSP